MQKKMLIFGFGYSATFIAKKLLNSDFLIVGTTRHHPNQEQFSASSIQYIDFDKISVEEHLSTTTHVLISTPPSSSEGDPVLASFSDALKKSAPHIQWVGYLSSTGVYGDHQGNWVDETAASMKLGTQGKLRLHAEQAWTCFARDHHLPLHIFRLAGIYGPQRNALEQLKAGKNQTIYKPEHYFSRIHVEDIANVIHASILKPNPFSIYNVADNEPAPSYKIDEFAAQLLNRIPPPRVPFEQANLSPMAQEFYSHHRRVSNLKIKQELGVTLNYPSYRNGLMNEYLHLTKQST